MRELLECPVCMEEMKPPKKIFQVPPPPPQNGRANAGGIIYERERKGKCMGQVLASSFYCVELSRELSCLSSCDCHLLCSPTDDPVASVLGHLGAILFVAPA
jgi:hypothetical protein